MKGGFQILNLLKKRFLFLLSIICVACEDSVNLNLPLEAERTVISGWITNKDEPYTISVSRTVGFNDHDTEPGVAGAEVYVIDRLARRFDFNPTNTIGLYQSDPALLVGVPGEAYTLFVNLPDGTEYVSEREVLNPVPELDTIFFATSFDPNLPISDPEARVFFVKGTIVDIPNIKNFYRWKMYINDTLRSAPSELVIFNDKFTDGNTFETKVTDILLREGDKLKLEQWSLTEGAFDFYSLLISQISDDQIGPGTPPSAVRGNIRNVNNSEELVLGYFGASQIITKEAEVFP